MVHFRCYSSIRIAENQDQKALLFTLLMEAEEIYLLFPHKEFSAKSGKKLKIIIGKREMKLVECIKLFES